MLWPPLTFVRCSAPSQPASPGSSAGCGRPVPLLPLFTLQGCAACGPGRIPLVPVVSEAVALPYRPASGQGNAQLALVLCGPLSPGVLRATLPTLWPHGCAATIPPAGEQHAQPAVIHKAAAPAAPRPPSVWEDAGINPPRQQLWEPLVSDSALRLEWGWQSSSRTRCSATAGGSSRCSRPHHPLHEPAGTPPQSRPWGEQGWLSLVGSPGQRGCWQGGG